MIPAIHTHLPPEIYRLVARAGAHHCFWWSNRWRRGTKPSTGQSAREMTNTVPGSPITATQSTTTAQPISVSEGLSFEGDDYLRIPSLTFTSYTVIAVARADVTQSEFPIFGYGTGSTDQFAFMRFREAGSSFALDVGGWDGSSNGYASSRSALSEANDQMVAAAGAGSFDGSEWSEYSVLQTSQDQYSATHVRANADGEQARDALIGRRYSGGFIGVGEIFEYLLLVGYQAPMSDTKGAIDRLAHRHGIA